ncbi:ATP phosphoribosyltransferase [Pelotomaculum terephthalicicum JT]|uniref:ATP phosphoribosyltransferase n=1 Tax=Pelotomaculum TaxID=191373 RepID=UPI0009CF7201|nr:MULTISPECIES: ATP phosphoribosyltransferase [Pelotomaculum]MCG9969347.1 ATP phosphoribosyltransferase [Pelotomaculum terephthalicicum JT]OPX86413.1 MAG: ATP phosphoribosyltransferase [Pelotomaculum sp. PtaB.Bin117]OPY62126.1 MAG: ATP phosphoribosyltransferase [Pelotomaculum sp. PtaU1.Bin065]
MKLRLGLPKGSLQEATFQLFKQAGFNISVRSRSYFPAVNDPELEIVLMRAQEIPRYVYEGVLDAGISGLDWIMENEADVVEVADMVYAKNTSNPIRLVIAVADNSDIKNVSDLNGRRVATELVRVTRKYLAENSVDALVEYSYGATEVKVPHLVDAIADITETGSSLKANNLRIIATILESTTKLHANHSSWEDPWKREKLQSMAVLLQGALRARSKVGLKMNVPGAMLETILDVLPAMKQPTISQLVHSDWVAVEVILEERQVRDLIPALKKAGAQDIIEYPLTKVIP